MDATTTYSDMGITTPRGAYWLLVVVFLLGVNVAALYGVRTHEYVRAAFVVGWMIAVAIGTVRGLRMVIALGSPRNPATMLAFQLAMLQPIIGIMPLVLILLP
jgi:hypothetical protein